MAINVNKLFPYISIRTKLTVAFTAVTLGPLAGFGLYAIASAGDSIEEAAASELRRETEHRARIIEEFLVGVRRDTLLLAGSEPDPDRFRAIEPESFGYYQVRFIDAAGRERIRLEYDGARLRTVSEEALQDKSDRYYVRETLARRPGEIYVSPMDLNVEHGKIEDPPRAVVRFCTPVADADGNVTGLVAINVFAAHIFSLLGEPNEWRLLDVQGNYLGRAEPRSLAQDYGADALAAFTADPVGARADMGGAIASWAPVPLGAGRRWIVLRTSPRSTVLAPVRRLTGPLAIAGALSLLIASAIGALSARALTAPVLALKAHADRLAAGSFAGRIDVQTNDELEDLAGHFNAMAQRLSDWNETLQSEVDRRTAQIETERRKLDDILAALGADVALLDRSGLIVWTNRDEGLVGRHCRDVHACDACFDECPGGEAFRLGRAASALIRMQRDGRERFVQAVATPVPDKDGRIAQALEVHLDITDSVLRERDIRRRMGEAEKMAALGRLSSSVVHEVANPLAAMKTTLQVMKEDGEGSSPHLDRIAEEIDRLAGFLQRVRSFSRPQKADLRPTRLDAVLDGVLELVDRDARRRRIRIDRGGRAEADVVADASKLQEVFMNLVLNAMDAMPDGGTLSISTRVRDGRVVATVRDTGVGILPQDREHVMDPYFTTKPTGTGLGLAIARQIVDEHGGRLSFESGDGTTFEVSLPEHRP